VAGPHEGAEGRYAEESLGALAHLLGGLVREGDGRDRARVRAEAHEMRQAMRDDPRLAGSRAREDEEGAPGVEDRLALLGVKSGQEGRVGQGRFDLILDFRLRTTTARTISPFLIQI
jgi:hypothetical protein